MFDLLLGLDMFVCLRVVFGCLRWVGFKFGIGLVFLVLMFLEWGCFWNCLVSESGFLWFGLVFGFGFWVWIVLLRFVFCCWGLVCGF